MEIFVPKLIKVALGDAKDPDVQICLWGVTAYVRKIPSIRSSFSSVSKKNITSSNLEAK